MISSTTVGKSNVVAKPSVSWFVPWLPRRSKNLTEGGSSRSKKVSGKRLPAPSSSQVLHTNEIEGNNSATDVAENRAAETGDSESHPNDDENGSIARSNINEHQSNQNSASGSNDGAKSIDLRAIKMEKENELLRISLIKLSNRLGDEYLSSSSSESDDLEDGPPVTVTTNYQMDNLLAPNYFYICNVSLLVMKSFLI